MAHLRLVLLALLASLLTADAQQADPAKLAPMYRQQRDQANDTLAACAVAVTDLQARIAELEKKLAEKKE